MAPGKLRSRFGDAADPPCEQGVDRRLQARRRRELMKPFWSQGWIATPRSRTQAAARSTICSRGAQFVDEAQLQGAAPTCEPRAAGRTPSPRRSSVAGVACRRRQAVPGRANFRQSDDRLRPSAITCMRHASASSKPPPSAIRALDRGSHRLATGLEVPEWQRDRRLSAAACLSDKPGPRASVPPAGRSRRRRRS